MTPLAEILAGAGPMRFSRFMEAALYHPQHGYYRKARDPFGKEGDYFTASQLQPVFGRLIAQVIEGLRDELGAPADFATLEIGAGRGEMEPFLKHLGYVGVDVDRGPWPGSVHGVIFANELFDALPVDVAMVAGGEWVEALVRWDGSRFVWMAGEPLEADSADYVKRNAQPGSERIELPTGALTMMDHIAATLRAGFALIIDYGYTRREQVRFPQGTLMSYRRHTALDDVLFEPGTRDITAHVAFDPLLERARERGLRVERFETLQQLLLRAGERDQFARALEGSTRGTLQLKTLLFGMGETFRVALLRRL